MATEVPITPDGARYLSLASGNKAPHPFHLRWLLPALCRTRSERWRAAAYAGAALTAGATAALAPSWKIGLAAAALVLGLPSTRFNITHPVLVDGPALGLATASAALAHHGLWLPALAVALVAGMAKETAPVFAACFATSPLLALGLVAPALRRLFSSGGPDVLDPRNAWILAHPLAAAKAFHLPQLRSLDPVLVAPWGGCVVGLAHPSLALWLALGAAYGQLCVATDTVRLYQWAAPVFAVAAGRALPTAWLPVLVLLTAFNPARGDGV